MGYKMGGLEGFLGHVLGGLEFEDKRGNQGVQLNARATFCKYAPRIFTGYYAWHIRTFTYPTKSESREI